MENDWNDLAERIIGYVFEDKILLEQALSHSSAVDQRARMVSFVTLPTSIDF